MDVVVAGPPCQGFSTLGKRIVDDPRNSLLLRAADIALSLRPKVIVIENVLGALAGDHKRFWKRAAAAFRRAGYGVSDFVVDARAFGVAQTRRRAVLMARAGGTEIRLETQISRTKTLRDVLPHIDVPSGQYLSGDTLLIAQEIAPGQKLCNVRGGNRAVPTWSIPSVFGRTSARERVLLETIRSLRRRLRSREYGDADPVSYKTLAAAIGQSARVDLDALMAKGYVRRVGEAFDLTHTFNGKFRRLSWDEPAPTVDTRFGSPRYFLHPTEHRGFTVAEAAAVQSFPDDFRFVGPLGAQYRMIGNAVPPKVGEGLALTARSYL